MAKRRPTTTRSTYVTGWLDSTVQDFLRTVANRRDMKYVYITCLDSSTEPALLLERNPELQVLTGNLYTVVGSGLLLPTKILRKLITAESIFYGFDEVWFFPTAKVSPLPPSVSIVGPLQMGDNVLLTLGSWLRRNRCSLGLGDGNGLNFVVKATGITADLIAHSREQMFPLIQGTRASRGWSP